MVTQPSGNVDKNGDLLPEKKQLLKDFISDLYGLIAGDMGSTQTYAKIAQEAQKIVDLDAALLKAGVINDYYSTEQQNFDIEQKSTLDDLKTIIPIVSCLGFGGFELWILVYKEGQKMPYTNFLYPLLHFSQTREIFFGPPKDFGAAFILFHPVAKNVLFFPKAPHFPQSRNSRILKLTNLNSSPHFFRSKAKTI
jgi:hypothetical protein